MSVSFIIPICIKVDIHLAVLNKCINSIVSFANYKYIYLINDSDVIYNDKIESVINNYKNIIIKETYNKGSADQQVFKLILDLPHYSEDDLFLIIQDSMFINCNLENYEKIDRIKFLWHFTNHIVHWDIIQEPRTEYNILNNINSHTDLIRHNLNKYYHKNTDFLNWALQALDNKQSWCGCFGNCCLITKNTVELLNNNTDFANIFINNTSNRDRRVNESIFALLCHYFLQDIKYTESYNDIYYDGYTVNKYRGTEIIIDNYKLYYCAKNKYVSKISFNR